MTARTIRPLALILAVSFGVGVAIGLVAVGLVRWADGVHTEQTA